MFSADWPARLDTNRCCRDNAGVHWGEQCFSSLADVALCNVYITLPADGVYRAVAVGGVETRVPLRSWLAVCVDARPARPVLCGHSSSMAICPLSSVTSSISVWRQWEKSSNVLRYKYDVRRSCSVDHVRGLTTHSHVIPVKRSRFSGSSRKGAEPTPGCSSCCSPAKDPTALRDVTWWRFALGKYHK